MCSVSGTGGSKDSLEEERSVTCADIKHIMPTVLILIFTLFVMVTVIPYAFSSVIKQLQGVWAMEEQSKNFNKNGIANVGYRPTFNGQNLLLETNIFGINKNLYNKVISVNFIKFIRPEKKFRNLKHLKKQIKFDIKQAKNNV